ncbi:DNA mismatch repair protein MutS [Sulfitobacter sp. SK012]|uniref:Smr/MutS family protein n=1 Tax=Sulfitobacter sp. SK012 TaxID=1389005 RepID=UPI000E0BF7E5|nr:Smr/MutS family protein [Sulfitobacter sp. SK012]AXI44611.1 DNA mismatch repair protein MutS [Sulfitobacter sp. SK012]
MRRRRLAPEEVALWQQVAERTERLNQTRSFDPDTALPAPPAPALRKAKSVIMGKPQPKLKARPNDLIPAIDDQIRKSPVAMDQKSFGKLKRGKIKPEGRIDLHGMTLDRAHPTLTRFILSAHADGKRLVLVITGKGKQRDEGGPIPVRHGVLRHQVPQWLKMPPLSSAVLQIAQAHISHGGGGAYYVYLRRQR